MDAEVHSAHPLRFQRMTNPGSTSSVINVPGLWLACKDLHKSIYRDQPLSRKDGKAPEARSPSSFVRSLGVHKGETFPEYSECQVVGHLYSELFLIGSAPQPPHLMPLLTDETSFIFPFGVAGATKRASAR